MRHKPATRTDFPTDEAVPSTINTGAGTLLALLHAREEGRNEPARRGLHGHGDPYPLRQPERAAVADGEPVP
jgi:hypothetical protein